MNKMTKEKEVLLDSITALRTRIIESIGIRNVEVKADREIAHQSRLNTYPSDWEDVTFSFSIKDPEPKKVKASIDLRGMDEDEYGRIFQELEEYLTDKKISFLLRYSGG